MDGAGETSAPTLGCLDHGGTVSGVRRLFAGVVPLFQTTGLRRTDRHGRPRIYTDNFGAEVGAVLLRAPSSTLTSIRSQEMLIQRVRG